MSSEKLGIVARNVRVEFGELHRRNNGDGDAEDDQKKVTPLDFYDGNAALTEVFHALSVTFPVGETFFINSVMHYAPRIRTKHPELWKQVQLFFKQEGMHTAVHEAWNDRIQQEYGHPMDEIEKTIDKRLTVAKKILHPIVQLAITSCLEHWTAGLGHILICTPTGKAIMDRCAEPYRSLWAWHALEEIEHKSVAFDVFRAMGGGYFTRTFVMLIVSVHFLYRVTQIWWNLAITRRRLGKWASVKELVYFLFLSPGILSKLVPHYLAWFKPGYHPSNQYGAEERLPVLEQMKALQAKAVAPRPEDLEIFGNDTDEVIVLAPTPAVVSGEAPKLRKERKTTRSALKKGANAERQRSRM